MGWLFKIIVCVNVSTNFFGCLVNYANYDDDDDGNVSGGGESNNGDDEDDIIDQFQLWQPFRTLGADAAE